MLPLYAAARSFLPVQCYTPVTRKVTCNERHSFSVTCAVPKWRLLRNSWGEWQIHCTFSANQICNLGCSISKIEFNIAGKKGVLWIATNFLPLCHVNLHQQFLSYNACRGSSKVFICSRSLIVLACRSLSTDPCRCCAKTHKCHYYNLPFRLPELHRNINVHQHRASIIHLDLLLACLAL